MQDFGEIYGLLHVYEKCLQHGSSLDGIKTTAWKRLMEINAEMLPPAPTPVTTVQENPPPPVALTAEDPQTEDSNGNGGGGLQRKL